MKKTVMTTDAIRLGSDGTDAGGFEVIEQPVEQVQIEFEDSPDGLTSDERNAAAAAASNPQVGANPPAQAGVVDPELKALLAGLANKADEPKEDKLAGVLEKMAGVLEQQGRPVPQQMTMEKLQEEIKELWYTDPLKAQMKVLEFYEQTRLAPAVGQLNQTIQEQAKVIQELKGRGEVQELMQSPRTKFAMEKYRAEVEQLAARYKGQPDAMKRAAQEVSLMHDDEYMEDFLARRQAGQAAANKPAAMAAPPVGPGQASAGPVTKKVAWTQAMEQERLVLGITKEDYVEAIEKGWIADPRKKQK